MIKLTQKDILELLDAIKWADEKFADENIKNLTTERLVEKYDLYNQYREDEGIEWNPHGKVVR